MPPSAASSLFKMKSEGGGTPCTAASSSPFSEMSDSPRGAALRSLHEETATKDLTIAELRLQVAELQPAQLEALALRRHTGHHRRAKPYHIYAQPISPVAL